jgi:hypothetical protein
MPVRSIIVYAILALVGVLGAVSDLILNQWARTGRVAWLLAAYGAWVGVATLLGLILRLNYFSFSGAVVLFLLANTAGAIVIDRQFLGRRLGVWEWAGIGLAVIAMTMMEIGRGGAHSIQVE